MVIRLSALIAWPLMVSFAGAATTASLSQCSLILHALHSIVQVRSVSSTVYISLKLLCLPVCCCGTLVLKSWAGVRIPDKLSPDQRK